MQASLNRLKGNLDRVRALHGLHGALSSSVTPIVDLSDLLRAAMVLLVSGLDDYVHEVTRVGMLQIWKGLRPATPSFLRFNVSIETAQQIASGADADLWLNAEVRTRHGYLAFQQPDKVADAIRLFSNAEIWNGIGKIINKPPKDLKITLQLIVERRNKIAHEADINPSFPGERWPITREDVGEAIDFIDVLCSTIHTIVV